MEQIVIYLLMDTKTIKFKAKDSVIDSNSIMSRKDLKRLFNG